LPVLDDGWLTGGSASRLFPVASNREIVESRPVLCS
jgi:hypothetical protein